MPRFSLSRAAGALALVYALALGCSGGDDSSTGPRIPAAIILVPNQPKIPQGLSVQLTATVVDASGRAIPGQSLVFSSLDSSVVTVTSKGLLHAVGPLGTVPVIADLNGLTTTINVEVTQRIVAVAVRPESLVLNRTLGAQLFVTLEDFAGNQVLPASLVRYTSNDTTIAVVDSFGGVIAQTKIARTLVRVAVDTLHVDVPVNVVAIPNALVVDPVNVVVAAGGTRQLTPTILDVVGLPISSPAVSYTSNNPGLFTVSASGLVTAGGSSGNGSLIVSSGTQQAVVGVYIGATSPVAITHRTTTQGGLYEVDAGPGGQVVVTSPDAAKFFRGTLPSPALPSSFAAGSAALGVAVNHAGTRAYVTASDGLKVLDLTTNTLRSPIVVNGGGTKVAVVVSNDDTRAYLGTDIYVYVIDLNAGVAIDSIPAFASFFLALHPSQPLLYVGEGLPREINLTNKGVRVFTGSGAKDLVVSPDGTELYGGDEGGTIHIWSTTTGDEITSVHGTGAFGVAVTTKYLVGVGNGGVDVFDRVTRAHLNAVTVGGTPRRPVFDPTGKIIIVPNEAGWLDFIE
ncbi:MAG: Ig-like domain-containing protein [Gemmatimonadales bacterium]